MEETKSFEEALESVFREKHRFFYRGFRDRDLEAPLTFTIIGITCGVFLVELYFTVATPAAAPVELVAYWFIHHPAVMWSIAPFVHRGVLHFGVNVLALALVSPLEARLRRWEFLILLFGSGFIPVYADGVKIAVVSSKPHAAAYGISGFVFGLLGFAVVCLFAAYRRDGGLRNWEWIIAALAVSAPVTVLVDMVTAYPDPLAFNVGHFGGLAIGMLLGVLFRAHE